MGETPVDSEAASAGTEGEFDTGRETACPFGWSVVVVTAADEQAWTGETETLSSGRSDI